MQARIEVFHGFTSPEMREEIKRLFNSPPSKHPLRILKATDAAREGINLQAQCYNLFHFDVPWNPGRLEQRNGRIDRKLQPEPEVFCHYFFYKHRPEDRILQVLLNKTDTIKRELGSLSPVLEARLTNALRGGISHRDVERLQAHIEDTQLNKEAAEAIDEELEAARDRQDTLRAQVDILRNQLNNSRKAIGLDERHLRSAISLALKMQGADPLRKTSTDNDTSPESWTFPTLQGSSWAETLDSLRMPRRKDQKIWEWQKNEPIRPIVFKAPDTITDEVVQLHLQHRIVQRLLSRFSAQGLIHHDLSRACLAQSDDSIPRVILLGRLSLYGRGAARLYEEIIYVTARWTHPSQRQTNLSPYAADTARYTMELLEKTLLNPDRLPTETIQEQLLTSAPKDINELLPHLNRKGEEEARKQEKALEARGQREAEQMKKILIDQRNRIERAQKQKTNVQLELVFNQEERKQYEADQRHWGKRLQEIEEELNTEPDRIRAFYEVQKPRIEPVGLVYLWPVTG